MTPSYNAGQLIIAIKPWRALAKGDVVVFKHDGLEKLKRINQKHSGELFVVGDNMHGSTDSRSFGAVPTTSVLGLVLWPKRPPVA